MKLLKKNKLFLSKKAVNDISIISVLVIILLGTSIIIPFVDASFDLTTANFDEQKFEQDLKNDADSINAISAFTVLGTLIKITTFDFGNSLGLPFWLDAIYTVMAIILITVISRNIWIGGGA